MSGIFIDDKERIKVDIYIGKSKDGKKVFADQRIEGIKANEDLDDSSLESHNVSFKYPTYKEEVNAMNKGLQTTDGNLEVNIAGINYARLVSLLVEWSFKDKDGNPIPVTKANIDALNPAIANAMVDIITDFV